MISILPSLLILGMAAVAALLLSRSRQSLPDQAKLRVAAARALAVTTALQFIHFTEEALTGFHEQFPAVLGLPPMPYGLFLMFNLLWIAAWIAAVRALPDGRSWAFFAAWFLGIAGVLNLLAHPILALSAGRYFPGLFSSSIVGIACLWLIRRLLMATR